MSAIEKLEELRRRYFPLLADIAIIGVSLPVSLILAIDDDHWLGLPAMLILITGLIGTIALGWRRRSPELVCLMGIAVMLASGNPVPAVAGLYTVAVVRRDRVLVGIAVLCAAAVALPELDEYGYLDPGTLWVASVLTGFVVAIGAYVGVRRDLLASLRDRVERAEAEKEFRADQAKVEERARIAREMHDVLAHKVSLIALHAGALEVNAAGDPSDVEAAAVLIRTTARQTLEELREVLGVLRSGVDAEGTDLMPTPTSADIGRLVDSSRAAGVDVELVGAVPELQDTTARAVFRVVQEGLTNVHKHARGAATVVKVCGDEVAGVTVSVANRRAVAAALLAPLPGAGLGLPGLSERVRLLGGRFYSGIDTDGGWRVQAWLPWAPARNEAPS